MTGKIQLAICLFAVFSTATAQSHRYGYCRAFSDAMAQPNLELRVESRDQFALVGEPIVVSLVMVNRGQVDLLVPDVSPMEFVLTVRPLEKLLESGLDPRLLLKKVQRDSGFKFERETCTFPTRILKPGDEFRQFRDPLRRDPFSAEWRRRDDPFDAARAAGKHLIELHIGEFTLQAQVEMIPVFAISAACLALESAKQVDANTPCALLLFTSVRLKVEQNQLIGGVL